MRVIWSIRRWASRARPVYSYKPPCVKSRGYDQSDLLDGVIITGASAMHAEIKDGAATLSF